MDDIFKKLSSGTRFSRTDVLKERQKAAGRQTEAVPAREAPEEDEELNFFNKSDGKTEALMKKKDDTTVPAYTKVPKKPLWASQGEIRAFRKEQDIRVYGQDVAAPVRRFVDMARKEYGAPLSLMNAVKAAGLKKPTPVQMQATPVLLDGRDVFVVAPTGSGKTLVFVISILARLLKTTATTTSKDQQTIEALIVSPTRELAAQICNEFRRFTPRDPTTGKPQLNSVLLNRAVLNGWQRQKPKKYPRVLVTTPKRLVSGIESGAVDLSGVQQIILDEADRLLDLGLLEQIDDILAACTWTAGPIQKALFSATIPTGVEDMARSFMSDDPIRIVIGAPNAAADRIEQRLVYVGHEEGKLMAIRQMLVEGLEPPVLIFTETIERAQALFAALLEHGITVDLIHSGRSQAERERIIANFRAGRIWFLITTDLLARGLDFPEVACVINYDVPLSTASYIHRIGRTGRARKRGTAMTLFTRSDADSLRIVVNVMRQSGCDVPEWMLQLERKSTKSILKNRKRISAMSS